MTKLIRLTRGKVAIIDDEDYELISSRKYHAHCHKGKWYAERTVGSRCHKVCMHNDILPLPAGLTPDHINGDGLDNRRSNLRSATKAQQTYNRRKKSRSISRFKGVAKTSGRGKPWMVYFRSKYIGVFSTEEEAARAYDALAFEQYGEFAHLNFPPSAQEGAAE